MEELAYSFRGSFEGNLFIQGTYLFWRVRASAPVECSPRALRGMVSFLQRLLLLIALGRF